ncbi:hypothetical protein [Vibrio crassostreae]|uniref:hypothetical protein n=1 Tax=Vibrio crassostreae TaxID=246167 RepID=UPI001B311CE1|nr:hypothetical protein [Vibrio crassostreae]
MKKLLIALAIMAPMSANAGAPANAGKTFAQITACHLAEELDGGEKAGANFAVIEKYKVGKKGEWWKNQMKKAQKKEFRRLDDTNKLVLAIMCGIIRDKYL